MYQRLLNIHRRRSWRRVLGVCGHIFAMANLMKYE
jgi:hypothetical protein